MNVIFFGMDSCICEVCTLIVTFYGIFVTFLDNIFFRRLLKRNSVAFIVCEIHFLD